MKKVIGLVLVLFLVLHGQPANAAEPRDFQEIGVEFNSSTKDVTATVHSLEYKASKWGHWLAVSWVFDNYARKKVEVKGTFTLHFATGNPVALPKKFFSDMTVQARKTEGSNWTWEFAATRKPTYLQWNPTKTIIKPSAKALRWKVPEFNSAITIWQ